ncbi:MAG: sigma-70 family RNA polymerase sigma factor [Chloroflexi bacterium]|nr:sigma-70 family RNA polymerase sigma factor [Chloroflexota bacterium]
MVDQPDQFLIERAQQGDDNAVALLYRRYVSAITRYIAYRVSDNAVVEDLTAEVFLRMVESLPGYRFTGAPFEAWLYRIAAARVSDHYRARQRHPQEALTEALHDGHKPLEITLQDQQELDELRAALHELSEEQQTILLLRFVERKSHGEVALIIDKSVRAVATIQHRALKRLAELLGTAKKGRYYIRGDRHE